MTNPPADGAHVSVALDVRVKLPTVVTTTETLAVTCGRNTVFVVRRNRSDNTWTVSNTADGHDIVTALSRNRHMTYDQAVEWATRHVQHHEAQTMARRVASAAAARQWANPADDQKDDPFL